ncbi:MAG: hypothetical protein LBR70_01595 [Lactobacillaceae bacterium]|nr:hypothetical protein [Lactobacillaceae bacterium]
MAKTILKLKNISTGDIKTAPLGFSWTVLLFGFFVPLYRRDWDMALLMILLYILSFGLVSIVFAFFYNKMYARSLFERGYDLLYFWGPLNYKNLNALRFNFSSDD